MTSQEAPGYLETVRQFVNTVDLEGGSDELAAPDGLRAWLGELALVPDDATVGGDDLDLAHRARSALRDLIEANTHRRDAPGARAELDAVADAARMTVRFAPSGVEVEPAAPGVPGSVGRLLATVVASMGDGTWERLKLCSNDTCAWAFYDRSRNRSGRWCTMAVCGNRMKARAYRARQGDAGAEQNT